MLMLGEAGLRRQPDVAGGRILRLRSSAVPGPSIENGRGGEELPGRVRARRGEARSTHAPPAEGLSAQFKTELALTGLQGDVLSGGCLGVVLLDWRRLEVGPRSVSGA